MCGLFPDQEEVSEDAVGGIRRLWLVLPEPPPAVQNLLLCLGEERRGLLSVAVSPHAVGLASPVDVISSSGWGDAGKMAAEANARRRLSGEGTGPVLYIEHGSVVAIVAQFGHFTIEDALLHQIHAATQDLY